MSEDEIGKLLYQAKLDVQKMHIQAALDLDKARQTNQFERDKAERQAELDIIKAQQLAQLDQQKAAFQARLDNQKADYASNMEVRKTGWVSDYALTEAVHKAYLDVAKQQLEKSYDRADFIQKASGAISTAYAAILAFTFGSEVGQTRPILKLEGLMPTFFLGLAIAFSTAYIAFLTNLGYIADQSPVGDRIEDQLIRRDNFIRWTRQSTLARAHLLQAAVLSLGAGIFFLPAAYIDTVDKSIRLFNWTKSDILWWGATIALVAIVFWTILSWILAKRENSGQPFGRVKPRP